MWAFVFICVTVGNFCTHFLYSYSLVTYSSPVFDCYISHIWDNETSDSMKLLLHTEYHQMIDDMA